MLRQDFAKVKTWYTYAKKAKHLASTAPRAFLVVASKDTTENKSAGASNVPLRPSITSGELKQAPPTHVIPPDDAPAEDISDRKPAVSKLPLLDECNVCYETNVRGYYLACDHKQCVSCMTLLLRTALGDASLLPLRCCGVPIDMNVAIELLNTSWCFIA